MLLHCVGSTSPDSHNFELPFISGTLQVKQQICASWKVWWMAGSEQQKVSPDFHSLLICFDTCVCAVSLVPEYKRRVTRMNHFPSSWPPHAPAKLQERCSWRSFRASLLNINAGKLKINSDEGEFCWFLKYQCTKHVNLALKEWGRHKWLFTSNWDFTNEKRNCWRVAE